MKSTISIIICTYNRNSQLNNSINSVLKQSYKHWELIIVDDGSTPSAKKVVKKFKDKRMKYFYKKHTGIYTATGFAFTKIKGEFFCFCDDDDAFLPTKLATQLKFLEQNTNSDACYSNFVVKKNSQTKFVDLSRIDGVFKNLLMESNFANSCFMFKTESIKKEKFNMSIEGTEAIICEWLLRCSSKYVFSYCPSEPIVTINKHESNISNNLHTMKSVNKVLRHYLNSNLITQEEKSLINSEILFREAKYYFWNKEYKKSRSIFFKSILTNPLNYKSYVFILFTFFGLRIFDIFIKPYEIMTNNIYSKNVS